MVKTVLLFFLTALAEIIGCFLPWLWLKKGASVWWLIPAAASLALFVWLLTLHPVASGRVYAAYGGVYVLTALLWLRLVEGVKLSVWDWSGASIAFIGMLIMVMGWGRA
ncbi:MAG: YnfA family protein [Enterobacterales bacterium endosymbiont of Blomia tropicalis]|uniref:YnfA family protein n=1 Tax=Mixta mediterraneensis TaxID=2758443 RepID=UPI0025A75F26|nr:YnfA family protein [Mixta mediterraneensis]MDL4912499.1 YnfA family protein [Mixta mediterraneensis]